MLHSRYAYGLNMMSWIWVHEGGDVRMMFSSSRKKNAHIVYFANLMYCKAINNTLSFLYIIVEEY